MAYEELKQKHSVVWGNGPYQNITDTLGDIHDRVIDRLAPGPGVAYLDLACGTGAVAERPVRLGRRDDRPRPAGRRVRARAGASLLALPHPVRRGVLGAVLEQLRPDEDTGREPRGAPRGAAGGMGRVLRGQPPDQ